MSKRKYDVYGMGNALVDMEFEVSPEFFNVHDVAKGMMTLVDEERQYYLMKALNSQSKKMQCGGSAGNTMIAVSQFGGSSFYSCKVARDELGEFYLKDLHANGVDSNLTSLKLPGGLTGKCLVMITPDADRTMNTFLGITATYSKSEIQEEALRNAEYIYIEGYLVASPQGQQAMLKAKKLADKHGVKTSLTFSDPNMVKFFKDGVDEVIGDGIDLLFCNQEEAFTYTGAQNIEEAKSALKEVAETFVITRGEKGSLVYDGENYFEIAPHPIHGVDSNGAGDMYAGAFLYGITNGYDYETAGNLASLSAAKVVSQFGPRLEKKQVSKILKQF